jgi:hypothetical protein
MDFHEERTQVLRELDELCQKECVNSIGKPMFKVGALVSMLAKERMKYKELVKAAKEVIAQNGKL